MATNLSSIMSRIRVIISDNPLKFEDRLYSDRQIADFVERSVDEYNIQAEQQLASTGAGPVNLTLTPTLDGETRELFMLYLAKTVFQFEADEARRVGFRITNVAGTVDGRGRYTSTREGLRDITTRINAILRRQSDRALSDGTYRTMARQADPNSTKQSELNTVDE